jgi:hypothetical protein
MANLAKYTVSRRAVARYRVVPCDNEGRLDPPPPRQRTWDVLGPNDKVQSTHETRREARTEAARLNDEARWAAADFEAGRLKGDESRG